MAVRAKTENVRITITSENTSQQNEPETPIKVEYLRSSSQSPGELLPPLPPPPLLPLLLGLAVADSRRPVGPAGGAKRLLWPWRVSHVPALIARSRSAPGAGGARREREEVGACLGMERVEETEEGVEETDEGEGEAGSVVARSPRKDGLPALVTCEESGLSPCALSALRLPATLRAGLKPPCVV